MNISSIGGNIPYILLGLLGFGFLVVWHELGHFLLAKANGVKVEEFSVGMGKRIAGFKGKETEYNLRLLPIGGYVRMLGEEGGSEDKRSITSKSNLSRLSIVAAGPFFNFVLAIFLYSVAYSNMGTQIPIVNEIVADSGAAVSELKVGDHIEEVDGVKISTWTDFRYFMSQNSGEDVNIKITRNGLEKHVKITPQLETEGDLTRYIVGIIPVTVKPSLVESAKLGLLEVKSSVKMIFGFFGKLFKGKASKDDVGGPVALLKLTGSFAKLGFIPLLFILALISTQLAIFNIIPIPALDGGWIVMLLIQMISGRKLSDKIVEKINYAGMIFLLSLMALVTIKDILFPM